MHIIFSLYFIIALKIGKLFILNGKWPIKSDKLFYAASSTFRYVVTKTSNKMSLEKIFSPGPLADTVDVMVGIAIAPFPSLPFSYSLPYPFFTSVLTAFF